LKTQQLTRIARMLTSQSASQRCASFTPSLCDKAVTILASIPASHQLVRDVIPAFARLLDTPSLRETCQSIVEAYQPTSMLEQFHKSVALGNFDDDELPFKFTRDAVSYEGELDVLCELKERTMIGGFVERRKTAWVATDPGAAPAWRYGKQVDEMKPSAMSSAISDINQQLERHGYDCALVNLYPPNIKTGMKYHRDPDQNTLFTTTTSVVSLGAPAVFKLRGKEGIFKVLCMHGDAIEMLDDCQELYEHMVEDRSGLRGEEWGGGERVSIVFKRTVLPMD